MARKPKANPGVGHNSGTFAEHSDIRRAMAIDMLFDEEKKKLNERHKRARKGMEEKGVILGELKELVSTKDMTDGEIEEMFKRRWHYQGATRPDLYQQQDLFAPKPEAPARRAAMYHLGLMAALKGEDQVVVPTWSEDDRNQYLGGFNDGASARKEGQVALAERKPGEVTRNGPGGKKPDDVGKQAEKDFKADNPGVKTDGEDNTQAGPAPAGVIYMLSSDEPNDKGKQQSYKDGKPFSVVKPGGTPVYDSHPETDEETTVAATELAQPDWTGFGDNPVNWTPEQVDIFDNWYDSVPDDATVTIKHPGVRMAWLETLKAEHEGDDFEATPEELAGQVTRRVIHDAKAGFTSGETQPAEPEALPGEVVE